MASNGSLKIIFCVASAFLVLYLLQYGFGRRQSSIMGYNDMNNDMNIQGAEMFSDYDTPPDNELSYQQTMPGSCGCQGPCDCNLKFPPQEMSPPGSYPNPPTCPTEVVDQCGSAGSYPQGQQDAQASCFPRAQLSPEELLPTAECNVWSQSNPNGSGALADRNFLQPGWATGISSVGSVLRNANLGLRSEPPNPQVNVSPWQNSTITADTSRKPLELGGCGP